MTTRQGIGNLLRESAEWRHFFRQCCEASLERLYSQAWQWRDELLDRGHEVSLEGVQNALLELPSELLPNTPAGSEDPKGFLLCEAVRLVFEREGGDATVRAFGDMAALENAWERDLPEFRAFLRERCGAALEAGRGTA
jgi:hypothetical protein